MIEGSAHFGKLLVHENATKLNDPLSVCNFVAATSGIQIGMTPSRISDMNLVQPIVHSKFQVIILSCPTLSVLRVFGNLNVNFEFPDVRIRLT